MENSSSGCILTRNIVASYKTPILGHTFELMSFLTGGGNK